VPNSPTGRNCPLKTLKNAEKGRFSEKAAVGATTLRKFFLQTGGCFTYKQARLDSRVGDKNAEDFSQFEDQFSQ
jgi:hypothetical protein